MPRAYFRFLLLSYMLLETAHAKSLIDCRIVTGTITECNAYGAKLLRAKEIVYDISRQKLIRVKTLPVPEKTSSIRVISVADMIEKYVKVEDSMRFKGSEKTTLSIKVIEKPLIVEKIDEKIDEVQSTPVIEEKILEKIYEKNLNEFKGEYKVVRGDMLSRIAKKLGISSKLLARFNGLTMKSTLRVGKLLRLPMEQKVVDALMSSTYIVEESDTLLSIAEMFKLDPKVLAKFNKIKANTDIVAGKRLVLPLPYVLEALEAKKNSKVKKNKRSKLNLRYGFGKRKLRVTATAYSSHVGQTDKTPFLAAWNNRLRPGMKIIAVSRDMLTRYGMKNGTKVRIGGLRGTYRVRDKMNKRYKKRIDIYMGIDRQKALRWGRRSVIIYW